MAYSVPATNTIGQQFLTITGIIQLLQSGAPPANIAFPSLGNAGQVTNLTPGQGAPIQLNLENLTVVRSIGLITCASICYVYSLSGMGYVYHANAGVISNNSFVTAMQELGVQGGELGSVFIAFAHPEATDNGYQQSLNDLQNWGIPANNIVEITNLLIPQFGLNNQLQVGY